jgi:hypothetical protein
MARRAGTSKKDTFKVFIDFSSVLMRKKLRPAVPLYLIVWCISRRPQGMSTQNKYVRFLAT